MKIGIVKSDSKFIEVGLKRCVVFGIDRDWERKHSKKANQQGQDEEETKPNQNKTWMRKKNHVVVPMYLELFLSPSLGPLCPETFLISKGIIHIA